MTADRDPFIINLHMKLGEQVMKLDMLETHTWFERGGGMYVAHDVKPKAATEVTLELHYIAIQPEYARGAK